MARHAAGSRPPAQPHALLLRCQLTIIDHGLLVITKCYDTNDAVSDSNGNVLIVDMERRAQLAQCDKGISHVLDSVYFTDAEMKVNVPQMSVL